MTKSAPLPTDLERDPTHLAAAEWLIRLQGNRVPLEEIVAWQSWLNESPQNSQAFARVEELSQLLRILPTPAAISAQDLARDRYDASVPLKDWQASQGPPRLWMTAAALLLAGILFTFAILFWKTRTPGVLTFATAVGQNRNATLSDGSAITLGGDTRIIVSFSGQLRAIELVRGEALFKVAKDTNRPFQVRAGTATIVAVGTAFNVRRDSDRAVVLVTEGRVLVEPVTHFFLPIAVLLKFEPRLRTVHVDAGQQTTAGRGGIEEPIEVVDAAAATAWQTGRLAFRLQPLHYVLEDVNRYAAKPIVLEGDGLGGLLITGTVERDNIAGWVSSLERVFDLQATEAADRIVIRAR